jgi:hypothetical protein
MHPPSNITSLKEVSNCNAKASFVLRAMVTFPSLQLFKSNNLFYVRCEMCKANPYEFTSVHCGNCNAELKVMFNVSC